MGCCFEDVCLESPDIQRIRDAEGDLARLEREKNWEKLKREMEHVAKLGEIKDEIALKEQVENWSHEADLTQLERDHVFKMQKQARTHIEELQAAKNEIEINRVKREWEDEDDRRDLALLDEMRRRNRTDHPPRPRSPRCTELHRGRYPTRRPWPAGDRGAGGPAPTAQVTVIQGYSPAMPQPMSRPSFMPNHVPMTSPLVSPLEPLA